MRDIPGYPGYKVTEDGVVHSFKNRKHIIMKTRKRRDGYLYLMLLNKGIRKIFTIHRLVATAYCPNDSTGTKIQVHHKDHNKLNNNADNLEWCDQSHNMKMNYLTGGHLGLKGKDNGRTRLIKQYHYEDGLVAVHWGITEATKFSGCSRPAIDTGLKHGSYRNKLQKFIWRPVF